MSSISDDDEECSSPEHLTISVRFWDSRVAFGCSRYCKASVSPQFMEELSVMNQYALNTSHLLKTSNRFSSASAKMRQKEVQPTTTRGILLKAPTTTTLQTSTIVSSPFIAQKEQNNETTVTSRLLRSASELLSDYYETLISSSSSTTSNNKLSLPAIDPATMNINCTLDLWIWIHLQGYFHPLSVADGRIWSILKLHDIGSSNRLITYGGESPQETTRENTLPMKGSPIIAALDLQQILIDKGKQCTVEETLHLLQQSLFRHNRQINEQLSVLRKRTYEQIIAVDFDVHSDYIFHDKFNTKVKVSKKR